MRLVAVVVALAGCGRVGFDDVTSRTGDAGGDARDAIVPLTPHTATVVASNADANDHFGANIAVSHDGSTIAIGASGEDSVSGAAPGDNTRTDAGAAYVFVLVGSTWTEQAYIKPATTAVSGNFGAAVALSDDGNTLAVGQPAATTGAGSIHVFTRTGTTWGGEQVLLASVRDTGDSLGASVALSSTGDTLIAGAPGESSGVTNNPNDNSASSAGAVYVFVRNGATWTQQAYLKSATPISLDQFGTAVACSSQGDKASIGAPGVAGNAGEVYQFDRIGTTWNSTASITEPMMIGGDFYGFAVAMSGDGTHTIVGSPGEDTIQANSGAAYVITGASQPQLKAPNAGNDDQLGAGVALADDGTPFVGAPQESSGSQSTPGDDSVPNAGAVYGFGSPARYLKAAMPATGDFFGQPIAVSGDGQTLAVSATDADAGGLVDSGSVTIFYQAP